MTSATIRHATQDDARAIAALATQLGYPTTPAEAAERVAALPAGDVLLVAVDEADRPVGWLQLAVVTTVQSGTRAEIHGLVVDDASRSGGIGALLVRAAEALARDRGLRDIVVRSRSTRERTHRFYERLGYVPEKVSHVFAKRIV